MTHSYTLQKSYTFNKSLIALVRLDSLNFGVGFHVEKVFFFKVARKIIIKINNNEMILKTNLQTLNLTFLKECEDRSLDLF